MKSKGWFFQGTVRVTQGAHYFEDSSQLRECWEPQPTAICGFRSLIVSAWNEWELHVHCGTVQLCDDCRRAMHDVAARTPQPVPLDVEACTCYACEKSSVARAAKTNDGQEDPGEAP